CDGGAGPPGLPPPLGSGRPRAPRPDDDVAGPDPPRAGAVADVVGRDPSTESPGREHLERCARLDPAEEVLALREHAHALVVAIDPEVVAECVPQRPQRLDVGRL